MGVELNLMMGCFLEFFSAAGPQTSGIILWTDYHSSFKWFLQTWHILL